MTTSILPDATQQAISSIDNVTTRTVSILNSMITRLNNILNNTVDPTTQQAIAAAAIIDAANGRFDSLPAMIAALEAAVNVAVPGTYPAPATTTPSPTS